MRIVYSQAQVARTVRVTKIVGDAHNLLILYELMNFGEKSFNELKRMTQINPVTLSKKLTTLRQEKLIDCGQCGKENRYRVVGKAECLRPLIEEIKKLALEEGSL